MNLNGPGLAPHRRIMASASAWDDDAVYEEPLDDAARDHQSGFRIRAAFSCGTEMALSLDALEAAVRVAANADAVRSVVPWLRMVESATSDVERWARVLGAAHVTSSWVETCSDWMAAVVESLTVALSYSSVERNLALELAAEESAMRLETSLEREGADAVAMLRNLDKGAADCAKELVARLDLANRMLRAVVD
jgi:hypothetical protein